jgi:hypothetical protein
MSFKLQDRIQSIKGLPGKYKRILLAIARRAHKDGTNIYSSKEDLGGLAGVSRYTVYRHLPTLIEAGILLEASEHTCGNKNCAKQNLHFAGNGHYTVVYNLNLALLQNATLLIEKLCCKTPKSSVAKCDAKQSLEARFAVRTPFEASAVTSGKEGKKEDSFSFAPAIEPEPQFESEEQTKIGKAWVDSGGQAFVNGDAEHAQAMADQHGLDTILAYVTDTFKAPKTARYAWKDFTYWSQNFDLTKRNIDAWRRTKKAKASDPASRSANPNCAHCKGPTYGSPTWEDDKPYCADCMKQPKYRRESGERTILKGNI